jgi:hypothetical protein
MSRLRIKAPCCVRSMAAPRTSAPSAPAWPPAARHGTSALDALTRAFQVNPRIPGPAGLQSSLPCQEMK